MIQWGVNNTTTRSGSNILEVIQYPISFQTQAKAVIVTAKRDDAEWLYDFWYNHAIYRADATEFHIQMHSLNNGQYIDGFTWIAIGY